MRVVIFAEEPDWHCRRLAAALRERGADAAFASLRQCRFRLGGGASGIEIPGFADALPDRAIVRFIPNGSFEQVTFRLSLLHALAALGIRVVNDARAIERCVDKSMTSFLLHHAGIPTPETLVAEDVAAAERWRGDRGADLVAKPLFGAQGRGLQRIARGAPLPEAEALAGILYLQRYVGGEAEWCDFRVFVVGHVPIAAMRRRGTGWITNVARGAACESVACAGRLADLAAAASRAVGAAYCGVDLIADRAGELLVLEVNSMPAWKGLQSVAERDIADALAAHVLAS